MRALRMNRAVRAAAAPWLLGALLPLAACGTPDVKPEHLKYMVMFDSDGAPVDPLDPLAGYFFKYEPLDDKPREAQKDFANWVGRIVDGIEDSGKDKVLVFIHGGLNEQPETIQRVIDLHDDILADGSYPIFVNWQSNLVSSYSDHLLFVRRGHDEGWWGTLLSPFYLLADVASGLFLLPMVIWEQGNEVLEVADWADYPVRKHADDASDRLAGALPIVPAQQQEPVSFHWGRFWLTLVVKPVSLFVVQAAGTGSWEIMQGRAAALFHRQVDLEGDDVEREPHGLLYLMRALHDLQLERAAQGRPLEVTLVGHSMGTIVANRLLAFSQLAQLEGRAQEDLRVEVSLPSFRNVVYLAAACSVLTYQQSVIPYMLHDTDTRFFHVVLDPDDELAELNLEDLSPRGSLLVWIDDFLANPTSHVERTAGRYDNLMATLYDTPPSIRDRLHVYVLPRGDGAVPHRHGDFTDPRETKGRYRFWRPEAWWPHWSGDGQPLRPPAP